MLRLENGERWFLLLLAATTIAVYAPALPGSFVYDDYPLLLDYPLVTESFPLSSLLTQENGRPLTLFSFFINYQLAGPSAGSFRAINIGLHLLAAFLLFLLVRDWLASRFTAGIAAAIFALHPLQSQPVNYIWSRSMLLMAVFALAALLVRKRPVAALCLAQLAIWSRAEALVLLVPLLLANRRLVRPGLILGAANVATLGLMLWRLEPAQVSWRGYDAFGYWLQAPLVLGHYLSMFVWPQGFALDHGWEPIGQLAAAVALVGLVAALTFAIRRRDQVALALGWSLLWLAPGLAVPNADPLNESRVYVALAGLAVAAALALDRMANRYGRPVAAAGALTLTLLAGVTAGRSHLWADEIALWAEAAARYPANSHALYNLGVALTRPDRIDEAEQAFLGALTLAPHNDRAAAGVGYCRQLASDWEGARWYYREALRLNADNAYAREALATLPGD